MKGKITFQEEQTFVGTWTWYLLWCVSVLSLIPGIVLLFSKEDYLTSLIVLGVVFFVTILVILLHKIMTLKVSIDTSAIYYQFPPFVRTERMLTKADVQAMNIRKYRPIWEFVGYGYRFRTRSGRVLNVAGKYGLHLILSSGKCLLIGTQKPDELERAIDQLRENWTTSENHG